MEVMLGSMVSTQLGAAQTYSLHPLAEYLDTDGSLLVSEPAIIGGFSWGEQGFLKPYHIVAGIGVDQKLLLD